MSTQTDKKPILYNMELPSTIEEMEEEDKNEDKKEDAIQVQLFAVQPNNEERYDSQFQPPTVIRQ